MYVRQALQGRLSLAFRQVFWASMGVLGFMLPFFASALSDPTLASSGPTLALLFGFAAVSALASIALDTARGSNVVLWTLVIVAVGAATLGLLWNYHYRIVVS